jgi:hypothetical protein
MISGAPYIVELIRRNLAHDLKVFSIAAYCIIGLSGLLISRSVAMVLGTLIASTNAAAITLILTHVFGIPVGPLTANLVDESGMVPDPHNPERRSSEHAPMAIALNSMTKLVFSRTMKDVTRKNSRLIRQLDPRKIEAMKKQPGKDILVFGSGPCCRWRKHRVQALDFSGLPRLKKS